MKTKRLLSISILAALLPLTASSAVWQDPETKVKYVYYPGQSNASVNAASKYQTGSPDVSGDIAILPKITVDGNDNITCWANPTKLVRKRI